MIEGRDRRQYVEWKLPPDDRRRERDIFGRAKAIKPSNQAVLQRCRDNEGRSVVGDDAVRLCPQASGTR